MNLSTPAIPAMTALIGFFTVLATGKPTIAWLSRLKMQQAINTDAPSSHMAKQGTPTMGGVMFLTGTAVAMIVLALLGDLPQNKELWPLLAAIGVFILHLGLGFLDDFLKVSRGKSLGLKAREKLVGQFVIALGFVGYLWATALPGLTTVIALWHGFLVDLGWAYYVLVVLLMMGMSNFTNVTDGLDGLAGGLAVLAIAGLSVSLFAPFAAVEYFGWAVVGSLLGFLWFNVNPAKVFMGDTGSLALGSLLVAMAVLGKQEISLIFFGLVFIVEGASVLLQVASFKIRKKRIFKMAPLHHHFELLGWAETQVVFRFWIAGAVSLLLGLLTVQLLAP